MLLNLVKTKSLNLSNFSDKNIQYIHTTLTTEVNYFSPDTKQNQETPEFLQTFIILYTPQAKGTVDLLAWIKHASHTEKFVLAGQT